MPLLWDTPHLIFLALVAAIMVLLTVSEVIEEKVPRRTTDVLSHAGQAQSRKIVER